MQVLPGHALALRRLRETRGLKNDTDSSIPYRLNPMYLHCNIWLTQHCVKILTYYYLFLIFISKTVLPCEVPYPA